MEKRIYFLIDRQKYGTLKIEPNIAGLRYFVEHGCDFTEYKHKYNRYTGLGYVKMRYERDNETYRQAYELLINAARQTKASAD